MDNSDKATGFDENQNQTINQVTTSNSGVASNSKNSADTRLQHEQKSIQIPSAAQDSELIEKEWVDRAKEIVAHTKHDPYEQQKALTLMKADYLKKRYNRDIKVADEG